MFRFDHSDPQFMLVYTGNDHPEPEDYRLLGQEWAGRLAKNERFGVIVVYEPHEHPEGETDEDHDRQDEAEVTRLINDFRRDYRHQTSRLNTAWVNVFPADWMELYYKEPGDWEKGQESINRFAQYSWGVPGNIFIDLAEAKAWTLEQFDREPSEEMPVEAPSAPNQQRVGLYYGSSTGVTEDVAFQIAEAWKAAGMEAVEPINIGHVKEPTQLLDYEYLLLGIPTWNIGELQDDWDILLPKLKVLDFRGKKIALFGIGDQYDYPDNFLDAVGILGEVLKQQGAELFGFWPVEGYTFAESKAVSDGRFMGLGIDDEHQPELTAARVMQWVAQVIQEFALPVTSAS